MIHNLTKLATNRYTYNSDWAIVTYVVDNFLSPVIRYSYFESVSKFIPKYPRQLREVVLSGGLTSPRYGETYLGGLIPLDDHGEINLSSTPVQFLVA